MRTGLVSLVGAALITGLFAVACGGDDKTTVSPATFSSKGESCSRTGDCAAGLFCINNRCTDSLDGGQTYVPVTGSGGTVNTTGSGGTVVTTTGGTVVTNPEAGPAGGTAVTASGGTQIVRVYSAAGESCTKTEDCSTGLRCIQQVCMASAPVSPDGGEAGVEPAPRLGGRGDTCTKVSDCEPGLTCRPLGTSASLGVCDLLDFPQIDPNNTKVCAECKADTDCCELPPGIDPSTANPPAKSCADVKDQIGDATALAACATNTGNHYCFLWNTYCAACTASTWKCQSVAGGPGVCVYQPDCTTKDMDVVGGCPSRTRAGMGPISECNNINTTTGKGKCSAAVVDPVCNTNADCDSGDKPVAQPDPLGGLDTCTPGECVCYGPASTGKACYRQCAKDLDCPDRYTCNTSTKVCEAKGGAECTNNSQCVLTKLDVKAVCDTGVCRIPCKYDLDCGPSGGAAGQFAKQICNAKGYCETVTGTGCQADDECKKPMTGVSGTVKAFCVSAPAATTVPAVMSAITTGK